MRRLIRQTVRQTRPQPALKINTNPIQLLGACLWPSFLWAGVATALFFSSFDPETLGQIATFQLPLSREAGYSIGFFGFWALGIACSTSTQFLLGQIQITPQKQESHQKTINT